MYQWNSLEFIMTSTLQQMSIYILADRRSSMLLFLSAVYILHFTCKMDKRPVLILRASHIRLDSRIWYRNHLAFGDGIYVMATDCSNLSPFCNKQHIVGAQKFNKPYNKEKKIFRHTYKTRNVMRKNLRHKNLPTIP